MDQVATQNAPFQAPLPADDSAGRIDRPRPRRAAPAVQRIATSDVDEFAAAIPDWQVELKQLRRGAFECDGAVVNLGPALVCKLQFRQWLADRVAMPAGCLTITRPGWESDRVTIGGRELQDEEVLVAFGDGETQTVSHGVRLPHTFSVSMDYLEQQADWLEAPPLSARGFQLRAAGREWADGFLKAVDWAANAALQYGDALAQPAILNSVLDALLARVHTLGALASPLSQGRAARVARRAAVERARRYIDANITEPIRLSELCKRARTQERSLEYGFREVFGVSPIAYVRATRLHRVRRLLRSAEVSARSISEIALDCGFWHLSQFAVDYKSFFGESPSVTHRRTLSQLPPSERRRSLVTPP